MAVAVTLAGVMQLQEGEWVLVVLLLRDWKVEGHFVASVVVGRKGHL